MVYLEETGLEYHIKTNESLIGKYVIMPGDPKRCEKIAQYFENPHFVADNREYVTYTGTLEGEKVSVISTGIGGPSAAIAMEEMVHLGAHTFIRVGTCGAMQMPVMGGDIIIATGSVRAEGTTREYAPIEFPAVANLQVVNALVDSAEANGISYHAGVVQSKDSFYGQHEPLAKPVGYELVQKWEAWKKLGVLASEMESAALFVVGASLHVRVGACFLVIGNQEREDAGLDDPKVFDTEKAIKTGVDGLRRLIVADKKNKI